jgi:hypothetical protein
MYADTSIDPGFLTSEIRSLKCSLPFRAHSKRLHPSFVTPHRPWRTLRHNTVHSEMTGQGSRSRFSIYSRGGDFSSHHNSQSISGSHPTSWPVALPPKETKGHECESGHLSTSGAAVRNKWSQHCLSGGRGRQKSRQTLRHTFTYMDTHIHTYIRGYNY